MSISNDDAVEIMKGLQACAHGNSVYLWDAIEVIAAQTESGEIFIPANQQMK